MRKAEMLIDIPSRTWGARSCGRSALSSASARLTDRGALGLDAGHQVFPGLDEGFGTFVLEPGGERVDIDTRLGEARQYCLAIASIRGEGRPDFAMVAEGLEGALRHRIDGEGRGESLDVEDVGGVRILGAGAGPEQALGAGAGVGGAL